MQIARSPFQKRGGKNPFGGRPTVTVALACVLGAAAAPAEDLSGPVARPRQVLRQEITSAIRLGVSRGFQKLISNQTPSGEFDSSYPVAVNSLVGLAFLAGGYSLRTGPEDYTRALQRGTRALLSHQGSTGYFDDSRSNMYGHGFATLYLAELYGTFGHEALPVRECLERALRVIEGSQGPDGGWDYDPAPKFRVGPGRRSFGASDTSITVCQTMALRAARNLGIRIDNAVVDRARKYVYRAQNADGGFRYRQVQLTYINEGSAFPRSAAGVCILYSLGDYNSQAIKKGFDYLRRNYRFPWSNLFPFYAHYYCAQAMFQAGGEYWNEYFPWISKALLDEQRSDGGWRAGFQENSMQATAMALIVLQLPYRFLPIHER